MSAMSNDDSMPCPCCAHGPFATEDILMISNLICFAPLCSESDAEQTAGVSRSRGTLDERGMEEKSSGKR
jgi:hypothetical protein